MKDKNDKVMYTDEERQELIKTMSRNEQAVASCIERETPFFVQGKSGWGKTAVVKEIANLYNLQVLTEYPATYQPEYLEGSCGMPRWANTILSNPKQGYLLLFDDINLAKPNVLDALIPIVKTNKVGGKKMNNVIIGATGGIKEENRWITELSQPLLQCFGGKPIRWETDTPEAWKAAFNYFHRQWDDVLGKRHIDYISEPQYLNLYESPRSVEQFLLEGLNNLIDSEDKIDKETLYMSIEGVFKKLDNTTDEDVAQELEEYLYPFVVTQKCLRE